MTKRSALPVAMAVCALLAGALVVQAATGSREAVTSRRTSAFVVKGELVSTLRPGVKSQVKVSLANKKYSRIWIKSLRLSVSVDAAHAAAGCSVARDFRVTQLGRKTFPLKVAAAKKAKKLRSNAKTKKPKKKPKIGWRAVSVKQAKGLPAIEMLNLPGVNQDACKGATLNLKFKGKATNKKPPSRKARG